MSLSFGLIGLKGMAGSCKGRGLCSAARAATVAGGAAPTMILPGSVTTKHQDALHQRIVFRSLFQLLTCVGLHKGFRSLLCCVAVIVRLWILLWTRSIRTVTLHRACGGAHSYPPNRPRRNPAARCYDSSYAIRLLLKCVTWPVHLQSRGRAMRHSRNVRRLVRQ